MSDRKHIYAPLYYNDFKCIADKCRHSCCIDWEICIDAGTLKKYERIENIAETITACEDGRCFKLNDDGRCPHLNEIGLCNIITSHGEEYLSDICKNHPRFFSQVGADTIEIGLGIVCEEVCRLILENDAPFKLFEIQTTEEEYERYNMVCGEFDGGFDPLPERDGILSFINESRCGFEEKTSELKKMFGIKDMRSLSDWCDRYLELEILDTVWADLLKSAQKSTAHALETSDCFDKYFERILTYFIYRHVSVAESKDNLRARLAFSILSAEMIKYIFGCRAENSKKSLFDTARLYSSEVEYSEDNTAELIFEFESEM